MAVTEFTETELAALRRALAAGVLVVRNGDEEVRYPSFEDLRARIRYVEDRIAAASAPRPVAGRAGFRRA